MTASASTKVQVNYKLADGTLINVYADDCIDFAAQLNGLIDNIELIKEVGSKLGSSAGPAQTVAQAFPGAQVISSTPAPIQVQQGSFPEGSCKHGALVWREGQGPKGPWKGWFCPSPKGTPDQCSPKFVR